MSTTDRKRNVLSMADQYQKKSADKLNGLITKAIGNEDYYSNQLCKAVAAEVKMPFMDLKSRVIMVFRIVVTVLLQKFWQPARAMLVMFCSLYTHHC